MKLKSPIKFGWCTGAESELMHSECKVFFHSDTTGLDYQCNCDCHSKETK